MPNQGNAPQLPNATWAITADDKIKIQELGRKLVEFLAEYYKGRDSVHVKQVVGGFQYVMDLQEQRKTILGDDFIISQSAFNQNKLNDRLEEPFQQMPEQKEPTIEERREYLEKELEKLGQQEEIDAASPAPSVESVEEAPAPVATQG